MASSLNLSFTTDVCSTAEALDYTWDTFPLIEDHVCLRRILPDHLNTRSTALHLLLTRLFFNIDIVGLAIRNASASCNSSLGNPSCEPTYYLRSHVTNGTLDKETPKDEL
jgi:hypothetical protein